MIFRHDVKGLSHSRTEGDGDRIIDHTILSSFHDGHLTGLILYRHILVDHTDTTLTRNGNGHLRLCDGIHGGRHKRHIQLDVS